MKRTGEGTAVGGTLRGVKCFKSLSKVSNRESMPGLVTEDCESESDHRRIRELKQ